MRRHIMILSLHEGHCSCSYPASTAYTHSQTYIIPKPPHRGSVGTLEQLELRDFFCCPLALERGSLLSQQALFNVGQVG